MSKDEIAMITLGTSVALGLCVVGLLWTATMMIFVDGRIRVFNAVMLVVILLAMGYIWKDWRKALKERSS